jgi:mannose/cellobiose epimerase-like protein (N-acyl-D-glucosamine 2-epimerase family)
VTVPDVEPGRRPPAVAAAGRLLFAAGALMAVCSALALSRAGAFGAAAYRFVMRHPDVDLGPGYFEKVFWLAAVLSPVTAAVLAALGLAVRRGAAAARELTWIAGCAALAFAYLTYEDQGDWYLFPGTAHRSAGGMRVLTPWRYSGWYHDLTAILGILTLASLAAALGLLMLPSASAHFRRGRGMV